MTGIEYHGPRQFQGFLEEVVKHVLQHTTREGIIPVYVGNLAGIAMEPTPHFIFNHAQNRTVEETVERFLVASPEDQERTYQEARSVCIAVSPFSERVLGGYQRDTDSVVFPPHSFLDLEHASRHEQKNIDLNHLDEETLQYINAVDLPHTIAHELLHWDMGEIRAYRELREAFAAWKEVAQDPRIMEGKMHELVNEGIERSDPHALQYSYIWAKIWNNGLYDLNEVIAECVSFPIIPSITDRLRLSVEAPDEILDIVHQRIRQHGIKQTLAFAKQLMDEAYRTQTPVYDLLRRA